MHGVEVRIFLFCMQEFIAVTTVESQAHIKQMVLNFPFAMAVEA